MHAPTAMQNHEPLAGAGHGCRGDGQGTLTADDSGLTASNIIESNWFQGAELWKCLSPLHHLAY